MKNLEEFLAAYVKKYGSVKVVVDGDASWSFTSHSHEGGPGVTEVEAADADVYIVSNAGVNSDIANEVETVVYSSTSKINYRPNNQPNAVMSSTKHSQLFLSDNLAVFSTNPQLIELSEQVGTTPTPEQAETMQVEEPNTVEELPEGFPFSVTGTETSEEDDEPKSEEDKVW